MHRLYRTEFRTAGRNAIAEVLETIHQLEVLDSTVVDDVLATMEAHIGAESLGKLLAARSSSKVQMIFRAGAAEAKRDYKLVVADRQAINTIASHDLIWIKDHYDNDLTARFRAVTTNVLDQGYSRRKLGEVLADELGAEIDADTEYWESLADHTVTKARNIGRISGWGVAGFTQIKVRAILDGKTSEICRDMNGRIIPLTHLQTQRDNVLNASSVEDLKAAMNWPRRFTGKTGELPENLGFPPYHYKCRTEVFGVVQKEIRADLGDSIESHDAAVLERHTPAEHWNRAEALRLQARSKNGLQWRPQDWQDDVRKVRIVKHGVGEFADDAEEYWKRAQETVSNADEVMAHVYRPSRKGSVERIQYRFFNRKTGAYTTVDDNGIIRGCYRSGDLDKTIAAKKENSLWLHP